VTGRLVRRASRAGHACERPPPIDETIQVNDVWECDECTGSWMAVPGSIGLTWLSDPIVTRRRSWWDRRRRARTPPTSPRTGPPADYDG